MSKRTVLAALGWALCLVAVWGLVGQRHELLALRARFGESTQVDAAAAPAREGTQAYGNAPRSESVSPELLRLRSEVTRLNARKRELASVTQDADRLRAQIAANRTSSSAGDPLPAGYMRKAQAQLAGFSTPENTIESFLWAVQHHDITNLLRAFSPEEAQHMASRATASGEPDPGMFKAMDALPGMAIQSRQDLPDGSVELQVEIGPGVPLEKIHLVPVNGEWKLERF